jgi:hypothetical protein
MLLLEIIAIYRDSRAQPVLHCVQDAQSQTVQKATACL